MANISTIVFDLGGVLIDWNQKHLYRKIFKTDEEIDWFIANICTPAWNHLLDAGKPFEEGVKELVAQHPKYESEINAYWKRWTEMLGGPMEPTVEILDDLATRDLRLLALTNWSAETFPHVSHYPFFNHFEGVLVSGEEKLAKPDPAIFHLLAERYDLNPEECLFIDDNGDNIQTAKAIGFQTVHFKNAEDLSVRLHEFGIL